ncbi:MAG: hypothetical protein M0Z38_04185 [Deltaproteobacteria bacterium]|nr:hypothetical protein [Deltaproteobacteria bacterium]
MKKLSIITVLGILLFLPCLALGEFQPADYTPISQTDLVKNPEAHVGKKFRIRDPFQFCGSDFCVQIQKTKLNTRDYYCFTVGTICAVRNYIKKDHPDAQQVLKLKKGDVLSIYGTFDYMGSNYNYIVVDHVVVEKSR